MKRWVSYHAFLTEDTDRYITAFLLPGIERIGIQMPEVKRFFFLRYWEGGAHLRLRFRIAEEAAIKPLETELQQTLDRMARLNDQQAFILSGSESRSTCLNPQNFVLMRAEYDRSSHYFGESMASVYSELINEQTSYLAIAMLDFCYESGIDRQTLVILVVNYLMSKSLVDYELRQKLINRGYEFATLNTQKYFTSVAFKAPVLQNKQLAALVRNSEALYPFFSSNTYLKQILRLIKRIYHHNYDECIVVHSIHLLCNKLGVNLPAEAAIYDIISSLENFQVNHQT
ncbi:MAG: lantibiotic dehydratase C-terminal domain-containing protein [Calditrichia bacterium]